MKRVAVLVLTFLMVAIFDWRFIATADTQTAPDSQAVAIPAPSASSTAAPDEISSQVLEIPLPKTYAGCWSGNVDHARLSPASSWTPGRFRLCFARLGLDRWTFTGGEMVQNTDNPAIQYHQSFHVERMQGDQLILSEHTTYRRARIFGWPPFSWHNVTVETGIMCSPPEPGGTMAVEANLEYYEDGRLRITGHWTADLAADAGRVRDGSRSAVNERPAR
jgi:hypothetical protein